jgi:RNA polymerase sigma-70 factor (ECF subfamily)
MNVTVMNTLVDRVRQGDGRAFGELYKETYPKTFKFLYRHARVKEDREDILQDTFLDAWLNMGSIADNFGSWMLTVAKINAFRLYRRRHGWGDDGRHYVDISDYADMLADDDASSAILSDNDLAAAVIDAAVIDAADLDLEEKRELILEAANRLPPKQKTVFQLRYVERKNTKDVEKITGMTERAVTYLFYEAQKTVAEYVKSPNCRCLKNSEIAKADSIIDSLDEKLLYEAAEKLPSQQRIVFRLKYIEKKDSKDIEEITGIPKDQIRVLFHNARKSIVKYVKSPNWHKEMKKSSVRKAVATKGKEGYRASGRKGSATKVAKRAITPDEMSFISMYLKDL